MLSRWLLALACSSLLIAGSANAIVNIDFQGDPGIDTLHVGDDGILSSPGGTVWNEVLQGVDSILLDDEFGNPTTASVLFSSAGFNNADPGSTNNLQDTGTIAEFVLIGLNVGQSYDIAVYGGINMGFELQHAGGSSFGFCNFQPTYALPGTQTSDYCLFNVQPIDFGGGAVGVNFTTLDGVIAGLQISVTAPEPALSAMLLGGLGVVAIRVRSRRQH